MTTVAFVEPQQLTGASVRKLAYRPQVDGLRAVAVLLVVFFHAGVTGFANGYLGVDIFFVISGYLITSLLLEERQRTGTISLLGFYERRARRIVPALVTVVAASSIGAWFVLTPIRMDEFVGSVISAFTFSANFWFLAQTHYFSTASDQQPLIHLWSLGVEEQFYVVFPLALLVFVRAADRSLALAIAGLAVASLALSHLVAMSSPDAAFYRPDTRAWELLIGSSCAFLSGRKLPFQGGLATLGIGLIVLTLFVLGSAEPIFLAIPVCLGTALVLVSTDKASGVAKVLGSTGVTHLGLISYSLYLWHQPLLALARVRELGPLSPAQTAALLLASTVLAVATWRYVERPFRDRSRFNRRGIFVATLCSIAAFVTFGVGGTASSGFAFRYGAMVDKYFAAVGTVDDQGSRRNKAIGMGVCHFRADMSPPINQFLRDWACTGTASGASVLVVGDSHAADKAAALKLNGIDVAQMTGAGCSAVPSLMSADCAAIFDRVRTYAKAHPFSRLIIANKQLPTIYTAAQIDEAIAYWRPMGAKIYWLSDMPQFMSLEDWKARNLMANGDATIGAIPATVAEAERNFSAMRALEGGRFTTLDSARLFCSITDARTCEPFIKGRGWLALPEGHLSAIGAYLFGRQLLADAAFRL